MPTRAVIDTNILISGLISSHSHPHEILRRWQKEEFVLVTSPEIIEEVNRILHVPRIQDKYRLAELDIQAFLLALNYKADCVSAKLVLKDVAPDPGDDMIISCAVEAEADFIVTGDKRLLQLREYQGIRIINAESFIGTMKA